MVKQTTIRLNKETKKLLDSIKIIERETYDSVINRIAKEFARGKK